MSQTVDTAPLYGLSAKNQRIILTVQAHTSNYHYNKCYRPSYCICDQGYFPHRLRMGLSYSKAGAPMYEHTFSGFRLLYLCDGVGRPSPRAGRRAGPPRVPSRQAGEAGGHGGGRSKRKGPPRVEKRAAKRGERSFFPSFNDTVLHLLHTFTFIRFMSDWNMSYDVRCIIV